MMFAFLFCVLFWFCWRVPTLMRPYQRHLKPPNTTFHWRQCLSGISGICENFHYEQPERMQCERTARKTLSQMLMANGRVTMFVTITGRLEHIFQFSSAKVIEHRSAELAIWTLNDRHHPYAL